MAFYSFIVLAKNEVPLPDYMQYLKAGRNVFNVVLKTDLETFTNFLVEQGVTIVQTNRLDAYEQVTPEDQQLPAVREWPADLDGFDAPNLLPR